MCECRSGFYRAANDANSSACTSELCLFVCFFSGSLGGVQGASVDSFVIHSDCESEHCPATDQNSSSFFKSQYNRNVIAPAER